MALRPRLLALATACLCAEAKEYFRLLSTGFHCEVSTDGCIYTTEFLGNDYWGGGSCEFEVVDEDWNDACGMIVDFFDVMPEDSLYINGRTYTGSENLEDQRLQYTIPEGIITWDANHPSPTGEGFQICPNYNECGGVGDEGGGMGVILGVLAGLGCLGGFCLVGLCIFMRKPAGSGGSSISVEPARRVPATEEPRPTRVPPVHVPATPVVDAKVLGAAEEDNPDMSSGAAEKSYWVAQRVRNHEVTAEEAKLPSYWTNSRGDQQLVSVPSTVSQAMESMVKNTFKAVATRDRAGRPMPKELKVIRVQRNENPALWSKYTKGRYGVKMTHGHKCTQVQEAYGGTVVTFADLPDEIKSQVKPAVNEFYLWHGTNPAAADSICKTGFDLARAGSNVGSMYGPGTYFAECSSKSDEYAQPGEGVFQGMCCFLLCRVVLGEVLMMTNAGEAVHGMVKASMDSGAYDSVLGNRQAAVGTYREFVVFQEDQIYPEFVVTYERVFD